MGPFGPEVPPIPGSPRLGLVEVRKGIPSSHRYINRTFPDSLKTQNKNVVIQIRNVLWTVTSGRRGGINRLLSGFRSYTNIVDWGAEINIYNITYHNHDIIKMIDSYWCSVPKSIKYPLSTNHYLFSIPECMLVHANLYVSRLRKQVIRGRTLRNSSFNVHRHESSAGAVPKLVHFSLIHQTSYRKLRGRVTAQSRREARVGSWEEWVPGVLLAPHLSPSKVAARPRHFLLYNRRALADGMRHPNLWRWRHEVIHRNIDGVPA